MSEPGREFSGKTIDDAIHTGLAEMGLERSEADIDIVQHPRRRFLGRVEAIVRIVRADHWDDDDEEEEEVTQPRIVGQPEPVRELDDDEEEEDDVSPAHPEPRPARAGRRTSPKPKSPPTYAESPGTPAGEEQNEAVAVQTLTRLLADMGFGSSEIQRVWSGVDDGKPMLTLNVRGGQLGRLIGRHGATLNSLQFILRLLLNQQLQEWPSITVDVDGYRLKQQANLTKRALRIADEVVSKGRPHTLEAMSAADRRIVHLALQDHPKVYTESKGSGTQRKIVVYAQ